MNSVDEIDLAEVAGSICRAEGWSLEGVLGGGAFKRAFRVRDDDGTSYALKILREPGSSPRTSREASALQKCDHPNIARLYGVGKQLHRGDKIDFFVEEYVGGGSLGSRLKKRTHLERDSLIQIGAALIDALGHLQVLRLVHRDIKPDNIMFREGTLTPVLVDFGLVRDLTASSLTESWLDLGPGTPYFASPEQLNNEKHLIDWRTDQFSLGVTLYFSRSGEHPYQAASEAPYAHSTVERVASRGPRSDLFSRRISAEGLLCMGRMTEPWPVRRFRTAAELRACWLQQ